MDIKREKRNKNSRKVSRTDYIVNLSYLCHEEMRALNTFFFCEHMNDVIMCDLPNLQLTLVQFHEK